MVSLGGLTAKRGRELVSIADGVDLEGKAKGHWVYRDGRSFYIDSHLCHPSVTGHEAILREIFLVFQTRVSSTRRP